ncbi:glycosyltransferase family 4 protein [Allobranchiibius huperziae]|uniref:D-inositol 3-phosphate glycosyltransferase n=1 Tax=Allobranchiibius huperziae TaxID=1874116 RepID=A0A853DHR4_9MICO|nr:glycosyltransferase family 1 protein [Allobranchiibius huperziae]NYJ75499.1 phosphatidylinositol alpha 1,6-mannosyltransferase [Allobranchiibius huperziae]
MRVAIVTESFLPTLNGVTTSVCRVADHLLDGGHQVLIVCPSPAPTSYRGARVHTVPGVTLRDFRVGVPFPDLSKVLADFRPDVVHAASPFALGARGIAAARDLGVPTVAVFQTDMATYLSQHAGTASSAVERVVWHWLRRVHSLADLTLAPSATCAADLERHGIPRVAPWGRGVDTDLFRPRGAADTATHELRRSLAPQGQTVVGYVGRLAPEKEVHRLAEIADLPDVALVVVGDGPSRAKLERLLPRARFLGYRQGAELARAYAAFDVFVHTGTCETFGQTLQEAMASGLPVVAPARGGPLDVIRAGVHGHHFDPDRPGALQEAVCGVLADPLGCRRMGAAGRQDALQRGWAPVVDQLLTYYGRVTHPAYDRRVAI